MAYDGWVEFGGTEIANISRVAQLAEALGIDHVWVRPETVEWVETARGADDYADIAAAPWYDPNIPASAEFAGIMPLSFPGLDDSTTTAETTEYVTDGGRSGKQRASTLPVVASVALIASTDRGAEYGKRWLGRVLRASQGRAVCSGVDLRYYRYKGADAPIAHRRQVRTTRGLSITRKRLTDCSVTWLLTFTLTCDDPFEYGEPALVLDGLGGVPPTGDVAGSGSLVLTQQSCPAFDYTPIYDPQAPALAPTPILPNFYPIGWTAEEGALFSRYWARVDSDEPSALTSVPLIKITSATEARMVRVSFWPSDSAVNDMCDPLFSAVITYLPPNGTFYIDGEQKACYFWDGFSAEVRRTDSLVYAQGANPLEWVPISDPDMLVTLDLFGETDVVTNTSNVRVSLSLVPKSD